VNGVRIVDDYGHHPVEIAAVLKAARQVAQNAEGHGRVIAVVQPHRYTRLRDLMEEFSTCFSDADAVIVADVYAAGEEPLDGIDKHALVEGIRRFVHVSSLAAREPTLSNYGWSKAEAETRVQTSGLDWTIVRPPAIFGPRDHELLDVFKAARSGYVPMPPAGTRVSLLYVEDLTALLLALAESADAPSIMEPDDGVPNGWDNRDFARAIGVAVGKSVKVFSTPRALLKLASAADRLVRRRKAKLTRDRGSYFCHPDWVSHKPPPAALWTPSVPTSQALAQTAAWYRAAGLL